jgi:hypothetical protein
LPVGVIEPAIRYYWESAGYDQSIETTLQYFVPAPVLIGLTPDARRQVASPTDLVNPAVNPTAPDLLLCRESSVRALLHNRDWQLVWLMTGQKQLLGGERWGSTEAYLGRQEISGIGYYSSDTWQERLVSYFQRGPDGRRRLK